MRTKNGADFIAQTIDSCIGALDELIIVYQESYDATEEIIYQKQKEYPNKIRIYFYAPKVYSHNLTDEEFTFASNLADNSIHLLSNYYNFALSKAKYSHAVKIDDDQIYFTQKLQAICDLYRASDKIEITYRERVAYHCFEKLQKLSYSNRSLLFDICIRCIPHSFFMVVRRYLEKRIQNDKICISLSGFNIFENKITLGQVTDGTLAPFNGVHDTIIFPICQFTYYRPLYDKKNSRVIESFVFPFASFGFGFMWIHLRDMKSHIREEKKPMYTTKLVDVDKFLDADFFSFQKKTKYYKVKDMYFLYYFYLISDMKYLKEELHRILAKMKNLM